MSLSLSVLGSGSGGNCTLVVLRDEPEPRTILIDAGFSPRETAKRLGPFGLGLEDVSDILLTHTDNDHLHRGWADSNSRGNFRWRIDQRHMARACAAGFSTRNIEPFSEQFRLGDRTQVEITQLPHDDLATAGFLICHGGVRLGFATDLGRVPAVLLESFTELDAMAVESNYDRAMQQASNRPAFLKRRIMGGLGHLSNEQTLEAVLAMTGGRSLQQLVLLHLSRQCNDPQLLKRLYATEAPHLLGCLTISNQFAPTPMLHVTGVEGPVDQSNQAGRQLNFLEMPT